MQQEHRQLLGIAGGERQEREDLMVALLESASASNLTCRVLIETAEEFDIDNPGKDSYEHRQAGALEVVMASAHRWVKMHESANAKEKGVPLSRDAALARMAPADLTLIEGFDSAGHPRLWIGSAPLQDDPRILAFIDAPEDQAPSTTQRPQFSKDDKTAILRFILASQ